MSRRHSGERQQRSILHVRAVSLSRSDRDRIVGGYLCCLETIGPSLLTEINHGPNAPLAKLALPCAAADAATGFSRREMNGRVKSPLGQPLAKSACMSRDTWLCLEIKDEGN
ncbi:uncharacterized protein TRIVIDRAFT_60648 [Trichoderma virens Gv29-8]|uniref:Uncharacterized protein n=1 Tax=Hypocrea virens (strain Gv29-8 / FGSC 10586) TaxID=413071 RepID=G9MQW9_HYPVG|nr:uncharacterized protein TRIVIDRAFT_60648 [Trichoderma virens Gv29-8]EHK22498.1 hypothetical protein TRIVIDRAFT_60648 [Trichoderma virens Gv29-8]UKZ47538.1 hypothetical protein TrVGV298_001759 [Trichoderma virens]